MKKWSNPSYRTVKYQLFAGVLVLLPLTLPLSANQGSLNDTPTVALDKTTRQSSKWANWILSQVQALPAIKAQEAEIQKTQALSIAKQQPLYNPELSLSYTEKKDEEYSVSLSQTIDWYGKRLKHSKVGETNYDLSLIKKQLEIENKLAQALLAYVDYSREHQLLNIAKKQEQLLSQFSNDFKVREKLGDVSSMDAEMAYLSITQNLQQISLEEIRYLKSLSVLNEALNVTKDPQSIDVQPDLSIWENNLLKSALEKQLTSGLKKQLYEKQLEQSQRLSEVTKQESKSNPTLGLGIGRDGSENTLTLGFSIPLNINNNYSAQYRAALHQVSKSEFELAEQRRVSEKQITQAFEHYIELKKRVIKWKKLTAQRVKGSKQVLTKLWQSGDIKTADYLFALQQRTDSMISNVELSSQMQKAWIEWLQLTSQLESWLKHLTKNN
jgi:outer membrane protein, heavy metal efflux system